MKDKHYTTDNICLYKQESLKRIFPGVHSANTEPDTCLYVVGPTTGIRVQE